MRDPLIGHFLPDSDFIIVWGVVPQFGNIPRGERVHWENLLTTEFGNLKKTYRFRYKPVFLRKSKKVSVENISFRFPSQVGKGVAVRMAAMAILDWTDRHFSPLARRESWIVMVDGSGSYINQVEKLFRAVENSETGAVAMLGKRVSEDWGISPPRKFVELFEKKLLETRFGRELPDCQAGIWAIRLDVLENVSLTTPGYGLEFDLAAGLLRSNIPFEFADVTVNPDRSKSTYSKGKNPDDYVDTSSRKLRFIVQRLGMSEGEFKNIWDEYQDDLPMVYKKRVKNMLAKDNPFVDRLFSSF